MYTFPYHFINAIAQGPIPVFSQALPNNFGITIGPELIGGISGKVADAAMADVVGEPASSHSSGVNIANFGGRMTGPGPRGGMSARALIVGVAVAVAVAVAVVVEVKADKTDGRSRFGIMSPRAISEGVAELELSAASEETDS